MSTKNNIFKTGKPMDIYAPLYYKNFKCVADKCTHSCCVGWQIQIDNKTREKHQNLDTPLGVKIRACTEEADGEHFIVLCDDGRCPFLDKNGLCTIISELGDEYISDICKEHPRFYNNVREKTWAGLGMVCREAARIILESDDFNRFVMIGSHTPENDMPEYDAIAERDRMLGILEEKDKSFPQKIERLITLYNLTSDAKDVTKWRNAFGELEYIDTTHKELFSDVKKTKAQGFDPELTRFLAYMIYRHISTSENQAELRARLCFCILCTSLLEALIASDESDSQEKLIIFASLISEEIEYSEENTEALIFEFECLL